MRRRLCFVLLAAAATMPALAHAATNRTLVDLPSNTALDLGPYACDQPSDDPTYCESITDYSNFVYDPVDETMLMFGGGHAATHRTDVDVFSFETLTWTPAYPSMPCAAMDAANNLDPATGFWTSSGHPIQRHTYDMTIVVPTTHELVLLGGGAYAGNCLFGLDQGQLDQIATKIAHYDVATSAWTATPASSQWGFAGSDWDPELGVAVLFDGDLYTYDPVAHEAAHHASFLDLGFDLGYANNLVYFPPDGAFYYFTRGDPTGVFRLELDRTDLSASTLVALEPSGDAFATDESGFAYDASNGILGGGVRDGVFHAYDPAADVWMSRTMEIDPASESAAIGTVAFHALSYDPVNNVFLFVTDGASGRHTWAYRFEPCRPGTCDPAGTDDGAADTSGGGDGGDGSDTGPGPVTSGADDAATSDAPPTTDATDGSTDATEDDGADGCGCRTDGVAPHELGWALALLFVRRRRSPLLVALALGCGTEAGSDDGSTSTGDPAPESSSDAATGASNTNPTTSPSTTDVDSSGGPTTGTDADSTGAPMPMCTADDDCPDNTHCDVATGTCRCDPDAVQCLGELPAGHWVELEGTRMEDVFPPQDTVPGSRAAIVDAWSGGVYDRDRDRMVVWGGGHADYSGNEVYVFDLQSLAWSRLNDPSLDVGGDEASGYYPDGLPRSRHTYDYLMYVPGLGSMCTAGGAGLWMSGQIGVANFDCFDFDTLQWTSFADAPEGAIGGIADYDADAGRVLYVTGPGIRYLSDYEVATDTWTVHGDNFTNGGLGYGLTGRVHPNARRFVAAGTSAIYAWDLDVPGNVVETTLELANTPPGFDRGNPGFDYDASLDRLVWWGGGTSLWSVDLDGMTWVEHPAAPENTVVPPDPVVNGTFGRFRYAIAADVFVLVSRTSDNVFARRL